MILFSAGVVFAEDNNMTQDISSVPEEVNEVANIQDISQVSPILSSQDDENVLSEIFKSGVLILFIVLPTVSVAAKARL